MVLAAASSGTFHSPSVFCPLCLCFCLYLWLHLSIFPQQFLHLYFPSLPLPPPCLLFFSFSSCPPTSFLLCLSSHSPRHPLWLWEHPLSPLMTPTRSGMSPSLTSLWICDGRVSPCRGGGVPRCQIEPGGRPPAVEHSCKVTIYLVQPKLAHTSGAWYLEQLFMISTKI